MPTLIDICGLCPPHGVRFDGLTLRPLLRGQSQTLPGDRVEFLQYRQSTEPPEKWDNAVITRRWRLIRGRELYDIKADPGQRKNVAAEYPAVVADLRAAHEEWWQAISAGLNEYCPITIGSDAENPTRLDAMDVMGDAAWNQTAIVLAMKSTGRWTVHVAEAGAYRFRLRRWPEELNLPIDAGVSPEEARRHIYASETATGNIITPTRAQLRIFDHEQIMPVEAGAREITFQLNLTRKGVTQLEAWFLGDDNARCGAYYVYVERI